MRGTKKSVIHYLNIIADLIFVQHGTVKFNGTAGILGKGGREHGGVGQKNGLLIHQRSSLLIEADLGILVLGHGFDDDIGTDKSLLHVQFDLQVLVGSFGFTTHSSGLKSSREAIPMHQAPVLFFIPSIAARKSFLTSSILGLVLPMEELILSQIVTLKPQ